MDPEACLEQIRRGYIESDFDLIKYGCEDLLEWINKGGFIPISTEPQLSALLRMSLSYGRMGGKHNAVSLSY